MAARSPEPVPSEVSSAELARAARLLMVRSRREATGLFAGNYVSAFRGSGLEFEESRPYVAGDDIRTLDWNATARGGQPFVKRFREERNQTLMFGIDVSASMRFGSVGHAKASTAVHALALVAAAAGRAGDSSGLVAFDERVRERVAIGRGMAHTWALIRRAALAGGQPEGGTRLDAAIRALRVQTQQRCVVVLISDFRDLRMLPEAGAAKLRGALAGLARTHDVIAGIVIDPREEEVPKVGTVRIADPERPGHTRLFDTGSRRARQRYKAACLAQRRRLETELRGCGAERLWLRTDRSPLYALGRFFQERTHRRSRNLP
jgi:uncharacterized protein (DUF58 family)